MISFKNVQENTRKSYLLRQTYTNTRVVTDMNINKLRGGELCEEYRTDSEWFAAPVLLAIPAAASPRSTCDKCNGFLGLQSDIIRKYVCYFI